MKNIDTHNHSDVINENKGQVEQRPRPEHPNPQFRRDSWRSLNGEWQFELDLSASGRDKGWQRGHEYSSMILVPFCPESTESGIGFTDFIPCCWYRRVLMLSDEDLVGDVLLHFGAVDYEAHVYINGQELSVHRGGYASFTVDITAAVHAGENEIVVCALDNVRSGNQPSGKQSDKYGSYECMYTRVTGIWQTVWLEFVPRDRIRSIRYYPNPDNSSVGVIANVTGTGTLSVVVSFDGKECGRASVLAADAATSLTVELDEKHLWGPGEGNLYDVELRYNDDVVYSYFGLRDVRIDGTRVLINGEPVFQRLVLDQGYYPTGIYTAPTAEMLERDIELSMSAGFNGARLHEKVFEPLFLYYCDKHGYLVWSEMGNWGLDITHDSSLRQFIPEWMEVIERDVNHPAIVAWCPFNETWDVNGRRQQDALLDLTYRITKQFDPSRPCVDVSGAYHVITDIYDVHDYEQDPAAFRSHYDSLMGGDGEYYELHPQRQHYPGGIPFMVSEYGGISKALKVNETSQSWGYGQTADDAQDLVERYRGLTLALLGNSAMAGFCYTQLYDVEQEQNGLYDYERHPKVDIGAIRSINSSIAALESE